MSENLDVVRSIFASRERANVFHVRDRVLARRAIYLDRANALAEPGPAE
jgi:hypothetical protein